MWSEHRGDLIRDRYHKACTQTMLVPLQRERMTARRRNLMTCTATW